jgi:hypothetical protein
MLRVNKIRSIRPYRNIALASLIPWRNRRSSSRIKYWRCRRSWSSKAIEIKKKTKKKSKFWKTSISKQQSFKTNWKVFPPKFINWNKKTQI